MIYETYLEVVALSLLLQPIGFSREHQMDWQNDGSGV